MSKIFRQSVKLINLKRFVIFCFQKQINARYQIQSSYRSNGAGIFEFEFQLNVNRKRVKRLSFIIPFLGYLMTPGFLP